MSSACVCHTNEWCFYCNMYTPLESKHEVQVQKLEQLIEDLGHEKGTAIETWKATKDDWFRGIAFGYQNTINRLREILKDAPENGNEVPEQKDNG